MPDEQKFDGPGIIMEDVVSLANAAANSERYSNMGVYKFVDITDEELSVIENFFINQHKSMIKNKHIPKLNKKLICEVLQKVENKNGKVKSDFWKHNVG